MTADKMTVVDTLVKMSVNIMIVDKMTIGTMTIDKIIDDKMTVD